jgi:hypothetical protein
MRRILAAAVTATLLGSGAALAQAAAEDTAAREDTHGSIMALEEQVNSEFARLGVTIEAGDLTLNQLSEVLLIMNDDNITGQEEIDHIEQVIQN